MLQLVSRGLLLISALNGHKIFVMVELPFVSHIFAVIVNGFSVLRVLVLVTQLELFNNGVVELAVADLFFILHVFVCFDIGVSPLDKLLVRSASHLILSLLLL
jgi:hypothetical protein